MEISDLFFIVLILIFSFIMTVIIVFQNEIRSAVFAMGERLGATLPFHRTFKPTYEQQSIRELQKALLNMSASKTGALIVITGKQDVKEFTDSGERIDAILSARLLENIFFKNSPLHDGAVFLADGRISYASCILPVSANKHIPENMGLRHRAAMGITERTDTTAIVVSEQTGTIAVAHRDEIRIISTNELPQVLSCLFLGTVGA